MDWALTTAGDWDIKFNTVALVDGAKEVVQIVRERLRTFRGEFYLDRSIGVPYFQTILQKGVDLTTIEAIFRDEIKSCAGVLSIISFSMTLDAKTRQLSVTFTVNTDNGPITVTETV